MGLSRQGYWSGLSYPPTGDLPHPGIESTSLKSPALAGRFFTISATWEVLSYSIKQSEMCPKTIAKVFIYVRRYYEDT